MDKYLKMFEPPMKKWLAEHYSPQEAKALADAGSK